MTQLDLAGRSPRPRGRDQVDAIKIVARPEGRLRITGPRRTLPNANAGECNEERYRVERLGIVTSRHQVFRPLPRL